jgi:glutamate-1-semialdehyde 2,1-aminomutase/spore coat polysaccharide biosynthesis protein SpsF
VSGTFGGEALSLAAAIAVVDKIKREPVIEHLWKQGARLAEAVTAQITANGLEHIIKVAGQPCWSILAVEDHPAADAATIKSYLVTRGFQHGVLANGSHNICYAHDDKDIDLCIAAYGSMLAELAELLRSKRLLAELGCEPVYPVFSVRSIPRSQPNKV